MATEIRVPTLGESVTEATIGRWFKKAGEAVAADEPLVELETDKVTVEVPAPVAGVLSEIKAKDGDTVAVGALLGSIAEGAGDGKAAPKATPAKMVAPAASASTRPAAPRVEKSFRRWSATSRGAQVSRRIRRRSCGRRGLRKGWPRQQG